MKRLPGSLVMGHEPLTRAVGELRPVKPTPSGAPRVLPPPPQACAGVAGGPTLGGDARAAQRVRSVGEGRLALVGPVVPALVDDPPRGLPGGPAGGHPWLARRAPRTLRTPPRVRRLPARDGHPAWRGQDASRWRWRWRRGRVRRRVRGAGRLPLARGWAKRHRLVASASRTRSAPRRAWSASAARAPAPEARAAGAGARRPGGREALPAFVGRRRGPAHGPGGPPFWGRFLKNDGTTS